MKVKSETAPHKILNRRALMTGVLAFPFAAAGAAAKPASGQGRAGRARKSEIYLLRGFANIFSTGIDQIGRELQAAGVEAHVEGHAAWRLVVNRILADRQQYGPGPVVLIGHSLGANAIISVAAALEKHGIAVDYLASFAATAPDPLPGNVRHAVNYYFSSHGWGLPLVPGPRFRGRLDNRDFSGVKDVGHFNIEKQAALQAEVVREVLRLTKPR